MSDTNPQTKGENKMETTYQEYLAYLKRNDPNRVPMSLQEFCEEHSNCDNSNDVNSTAHPIHY